MSTSEPNDKVLLDLVADGWVERNGDRWRLAMQAAGDQESIDTSEPEEVY